MLLDIMLLPFPEDAADEADARIGGRGDARFEEIAPIAVDALDILVRADLIARIVVKIDRRTIERVIEIGIVRSEEHTSELQSLMRLSYAVFCLTKQKTKTRK